MLVPLAFNFHIENIMTGSYDLTLVFASYCVAVVAAYTAIYFGTKVFDLEGGSRKFWLAAGAVCMGSGVWSMHFVGMSAYQMPMNMEMSFNAGLTLISWIPAVLASALALYVITQTKVSKRSITVSSFMMGAGIFSMHYTGMYAMQMDPPIQYDPLMVFLSGVVAVGASGAALVICRQLRSVNEKHVLLLKIGAAMIMGIAIAGMHYVGMFAASFPMDANIAQTNSLRGNWMGTPTAVVSCLFLAIAGYIAFLDFRDIEQSKKAEQKAQQDAQYAAFTDLATGLPNRAAIESAVLDKIKESSNNNRQTPFTVMYFELTNYRSVTQKRGEQPAQKLAKIFSKALTQQLTSADIIARYNSSGFIAVIEQNASASIRPALEALKSEFSAPVTIEGNFVACHWGLGVSEFPASGSNSRNLIRAAQQIRSTFKPQKARPQSTPAEA